MLYQWFNQVKHYLKLYKSTNLEELKENLKKSIKHIRKNIIRIILYMLIKRDIIKIKYMENQIRKEN